MTPYERAKYQDPWPVIFYDVFLDWDTEGIEISHRRQAWLRHDQSSCELVPSDTVLDPYDM